MREHLKPSPEQILRLVSLRGHLLRTWDTHRSDSLGKFIIGYQFYDPSGELIFEGEDLSCSPMHAIDSDEVLYSLLTFLTLRPGDTDREYFDAYTDEQRAWMETHAEHLSASVTLKEPFEDFLSLAKDADE